MCIRDSLKEAQNPIANAFDSVVAENEETLPEVESVLYEDEIGLVGWIKSERILVGCLLYTSSYFVMNSSHTYCAQIFVCTSLPCLHTTSF